VQHGHRGSDCTAAEQQQQQLLLLLLREVCLRWPKQAAQHELTIVFVIIS
jgi:hypothetical protein